MWGRALGITLWLAWLFGLLEALQHFLLRHTPTVLAIEKVSADVFWVAPLVYLLVFAGVLVGILVLRFFLPGLRADVVLVFLLGFAGIYGSVSLTRKVQWMGAIAVSLGVGVALARAFAARPEMGLRLKRWVWVPLLGIGLTAAGLAATRTIQERAAVAGLPAAAEGSPNIVFIVMDTVRADHLSLHGYLRPTSPNLEKLAESGAVFENAWSTSSWTVPTHGSMFTGRPAYEHGADRNSRLGGQHPVIAKFLRDHGYRTGAFSGNSLWISPEYGFDRGFEHFEVYSPFTIAVRTSYGRRIHRRLLRRGYRYEIGHRLKAEDLNRRLLRWLDSSSRRPFFAFLNYFDAHDPYWPPPGYEDIYRGQDPPEMLFENEKHRKNINAYDALIQYTDAQIGQLVAELEQRDLLRNTLFVITSDHGESLGDHGQPQHGKTLYQEVLHVHLVLVAPGKVPAGIRVRTPASVQQIPATLADLLGVPDSPFPGPSLVRFFEPGGNGGDDVWVLAELKKVGAIPVYKSIIDRDRQFIWDIPNKKAELFHLWEDPRQLRDISETPEAKPLLESYFARLRALFPDLNLPTGSAGKTE